MNSHSRGEEIRKRAGKLVTNARYRARQKGLECTLTPEWVAERIAQNVCAATGLPFDLRPDPYRRRNPYSPSLDRLDNSLGYVEGNVQVVCTAFNIMRNEMSEQEMLLLCMGILKRRNLI